jgi:hypothetical protein
LRSRDFNRDLVRNRTHAPDSEGRLLRHILFAIAGDTSGEHDDAVRDRNRDAVGVDRRLRAELVRYVARDETLFRHEETRVSRTTSGA